MKPQATRTPATGRKQARRILSSTIELLKDTAGYGLFTVIALALFVGLPGVML